MYKSSCTREVHRRTANGPPRLACCCNSTAGFCNGLVVYRLDRFVAGSFLISKHFYFKNVQAASNSVRHSNIYSAGLFPRLSDFSIEMKDLPLSCIIIFIHRVHKNFPPFSWTGWPFRHRISTTSDGLCGEMKTTIFSTPKPPPSSFCFGKGKIKWLLQLQ